MAKATRILLLTVMLTGISFALIHAGTPAAQGGPPEFVLETTRPSVGRKVKMYKTRTVNAAAEATRLRASMGLRGQVRSANQGVSINDGDRILGVFEGSGAVVFADRGKLFSTVAGQSLPNRGQAMNIARDFFSRHGLLPKEAQILDVSETRTATVTGPNATPSEVVNNLVVHFNFKIEGQEVVGPGAKMSVTIGANGEVIGAYRAWRDIESEVEVDAGTPDRALSKFIEISRASPPNLFKTATLKPVNKVRIRHFQVGYMLAPGPEGSRNTLEPVYVFRGKLEGHREPDEVQGNRSKGAIDDFEFWLPVEARALEAVSVKNPQPPMR
ncbi:MAG: hypothetical protein RMM98_02305 [Acidobacteriota bacterium]|nr:hypothetical protein [Blastocatellia bacterium]MDW8238421.1 hypothetical protein [Acidobacteriota bacterium]